MIKNKIKASLIHLFLSIVVVSLIISAVIYFWYPLEYLGITSFKEIALLIISIDLVLGPMLTFVVFNPTKKSLRLDLAAIAVIQLSALGYGAYTLFETHPVYLTYSNNSFVLINAKDVQPEKAKHDEYKISKLHSAKLAYVEMPTDFDNLLNVTINNHKKGTQKLEQRTEFYKPYNNHIDDILKGSLDSDLIFADKANNDLTTALLSKHGDIDKLAFLPLRGSAQDVIIVLDKATAKPVETLKIDPWKYAKK